MELPETAEHWQECVNWSDFLLTMERLKRLGLVMDGPDVNLERCEELLKLGKDRGYLPLPPDQLVAKYIPLLKAISGPSPAAAGRGAKPKTRTKGAKSS